MIPFKMMYNMSVFCHWFSNKRLGGGAGGVLNDLPLWTYFVKVCILIETNQSDKVLVLYFVRSLPTISDICYDQTFCN